MTLVYRHSRHFAWQVHTKLSKREKATGKTLIRFKRP